MKLPKYVITIPIPTTVKLFFQNMKNFAVIIGKASMIALGASLVLSIPMAAIIMFITAEVFPYDTAALFLRCGMSLVWLITFFIVVKKVNDERQ
jgi:hypothetical protein